MDPSTNLKSVGEEPATAEYAFTKIGHNSTPKGLSNVGKGMDLSWSSDIAAQSCGRVIAEGVRESRKLRGEENKFLKERRE